MKPVPSQSARHLAQKVGARMLIVLALEDEGYAVTSFGRRVSEDEAAKRLGDRIAGMLEDGKLAAYPQAVEGSDLRSLEGRTQKLTELLAQALAGHGGDSCPFGDVPCHRCRLAREWAAYAHGSEEKPTLPKRKRCLEDGCRRMAVAPGPYCSPCRQTHREAYGLEQRTS